MAIINFANIHKLPSFKYLNDFYAKINSNKLIKRTVPYGSCVSQLNWIFISTSVPEYIWILVESQILIFLYILFINFLICVCLCVLPGVGGGVCVETVEEILNNETINKCKICSDKLLIQKRIDE